MVNFWVLELRSEVNALIKRIECGFKDHDHYGLFMEIKIQYIFITEELKGFGKITMMILEIFQDIGPLVQKKWQIVSLITTRSCFPPRATVNRRKQST